jgi:hypothetical protein
MEHIQHFLSLELTNQQFSGQADEFYEDVVVNAVGI